ncbi:5'-3' exonuclease H3TH domain-containing protein [Lentibacillus sp. CBA3610]|uniref:5'-3' exonuclease n=1 Tax=Lentibacillus sp. CBA3610 TaxID=2518176 RepID=UPI001595CC8C|nr:5'-3' exonuclease H3TH domain-containing protein [Lentibacillus sp. CBA3610]QKY69139.1 5'-3' exonuclease [Lentibacillus sp. CBA3610]
MTTKHHNIMLVDGMVLLFRGFFATAFTGNFMKTKSGMPTNGVYQFMRYFLNAADKFAPTHIICCWDMGSKTFRTDLYDGYKANRSEPPEELIPQFDLVKEVVEAFAIPNIGLENFEADDCIGTLAKEYSKDHDVLILTGDQDILQLVDDGISVAIMRKGIGNYEIFKSETFVEQKGINPKQIVDLKGLMGDTSDNYPGVKGIGEKTALKLIQEYKSVDEVLENMDKLPRGVQKKIRENIDMLHLSRQLAEIRCDISVACTLDDAVWQYDKHIVEEKFADLEFGNLVKLVN